MSKELPMPRRHVVFVTWKTGNAPAFEAAARLGHHVTLIRSARMERSQNIDFDTTPYGRFVDDVRLLPDATDLDELRACITSLHRERPIDGFVATVDALVVPVAVIAEELGIPFTSAEGARTAKRKDRCRAVLTEAGIDATPYRVVNGLAEAREFADGTGYPVVLKPACGSASEGAHVVADETALDKLFQDIDPHGTTYGQGVLMEEYLTGRFVSAEVGLVEGRFLPLAVSERSTWQDHEALETGTTIPAGITGADHTAVMAFAEQVVRAVGLGMGIFHVEIMIGDDGRPRLIELNPRLMGSCLPNLFRLAGGGDLFTWLVRIHLGEDPGVEPPGFTGYATVRWFGAVERQPTPAAAPDLSWADEYGPALHSLTVRYPDAPFLEPCRGNLGNFGEVQVVHPDHDTSIRIARRVVERVHNQLGFEVTR
ncbi:ATP-grasp domain-containing protein [Streptomyces sp. PTM05]|uniref:ATP-grasp domain-containing protein n=2 Tax=Streptantibioticus parmotrematis TaxID=2873249 RepID=A0ABS7QMV9_9ACTN|nr:ATP-grasp domain-containing protein [Streptantibioticus parmotrematis]